MEISNKGIISQSLANKMLYCIKEYEAIKNKKIAFKSLRNSSYIEFETDKNQCFQRL